MKPAPFAYAQPATLDDAVNLLAAAHGGARVLAGGQSLGPMLNLRLAQPELLVDIRCIPELNAAIETADGIELGALVTHALIEDGQVPDVTGGFMRRVAADIAYRAIRNRGTIGGSICHADPAADWLSVLTLLRAHAMIVGSSGRRTLAIEQFVTGAYTTALAEDEILTAIRIPRPAPDARWSYYKVCRKPGEFAHAMVAAMTWGGGKASRLVLGALDRAPLVIETAHGAGRELDQRGAQEWIATAGIELDAYRLQVCATALRRAVAELGAAPA